MRGATKMRKRKIDKKSMERRVTKEGFFIGITVFIIIILMVGIFETLNDILFLPGALSTNGIIISCQVEHQLKGGDYCGATISFETRSSEHVTFYDAAGDSKEGDTVMVKYHPNDPQGARIDTLSYYLTLDGIGFGLFLVDLCIFLAWKRYRAREYAQKYKGQASSKKRKSQIKRPEGYKRR
jgi:hypothetical protein